VRNIAVCWLFSVIALIFFFSSLSLLWCRGSGLLAFIWFFAAGAFALGLICCFFFFSDYFSRGDFDWFSISSLIFASLLMMISLSLIRLFLLSAFHFDYFSFISFSFSFLRAADDTLITMISFHSSLIDFDVAGNISIIFIDFHWLMRWKSISFHFSDYRRCSSASLFLVGADFVVRGLHFFSADFLLSPLISIIYFFDFRLAVNIDYQTFLSSSFLRV